MYMIHAQARGGGVGLLARLVCQLYAKEITLGISVKTTRAAVHSFLLFCCGQLVLQCILSYNWVRRLLSFKLRSIMIINVELYSIFNTFKGKKVT